MMDEEFVNLYITKLSNIVGDYTSRIIKLESQLEVVNKRLESKSEEFNKLEQNLGTTLETSETAQ